MSFETDGQGLLELELFPGTYTLVVYSSQLERWRPMALRWTSTSISLLELRVQSVGS